MSKPQWITISLAIFLVIGLYAATQNNLFGTRAGARTSLQQHVHEPAAGAFTTDSILYYAKQNLPPEAANRLAQLENSISRGDVSEQRLHLMHHLARYWADSAGAFTSLAFYPYAYYTGEAARLENSEKTLSFAAHLFLNVLANEESAPVKEWDALQAKDLFERSLKLNPNNDSSKVGLGATILYGGLDAPMTGIGMIREVAERDSTNTFAQLTLGEASLLSGQLDKAVERLKTVLRLERANLKAGLLLADTYEKMEKKEEAVQAYKMLLPYITNPEMKTEVQKRITQLKTK